MWYSYTKFIFAGKNDVLNILNDNSLFSEVNKISKMPKLQPMVAYFLNQNVPPQAIHHCVKKIEFLISKNVSLDIWATKKNVKFFGVIYTNWQDFSTAVDRIYMPLHEKDLLNKQKLEQKLEQKDNSGPLINKENSIIVIPIYNVSEAVKYGTGTPWCISRPGNTMYQSYRLRNNSTFYFVFDNTRQDALSRVAVDVAGTGVHLTDLNNRTGTIFEFGKDWQAYFKYLQDHGIDTSQFKNRPSTPEEAEEDRLLSRPINSLEDFINTPADFKLKYIGYGNRLTNEQLQYLIDNKITRLLEQYVSTGLSLLPEQEEMIKKHSGLYKTYQRYMDLAENEINQLFENNPNINKIKFLITSKYYNYIKKFLEQTPQELQKTLVSDIYDTFEEVINEEEVDYSQIETNALISLLVVYGLDVSLAIGYLKESPSTIQFLIDSGANLDVICHQVKTLESIKYLVEHVHVDPSVFYPLTWVKNSREVDEYLIKHGANKITAFFNTSIEYYASQMRPELKDVLEYFDVSNLDEIIDKRKTSINNNESIIWMMRNGLSPEAGIYLSKDFWFVMTIINNHKIDFNEYVKRFARGNSSAAVVAAKTWPVAYGLLLNTNCNPNIIFGRKDFIQFLNNDGIMKALLEKGCDPSEYLKYLVECESNLYNTKDADILVEAGADINIGLNTMLSKVFRGAIHYNDNMIKLMELGADVTQAARGIAYGALTTYQAAELIGFGVDPQYIYNHCISYNNLDLANTIAKYHKINYL